MASMPSPSRASRHRSRHRTRTSTPATGDDQRVPVRDAYAERPAGKRLVTVGSHGNVELAVNQGRGDDAFGVEVGDAVDLAW